jgi:hypothetical protein
MSQTKAQLIDGKSAEIEFTGGSASGPAISFTGDSNTGIYSPGADQVAVATNGTGRLFVDASGNVGVGTSSPSSLLEISSSSTPQFLISNTSNSISAGDNIGTIDYRAGSSNTVVARMAATADSANEDGAHIIFENRTGGGAFSEKARIDSSGRLLPGGRLLLAHQRSGAVGGNTILNSGDQAGYITFQGNDGGQVVECAVGTYENGYLRFGTPAAGS